MSVPDDLPIRKSWRVFAEDKPSTLADEAKALLAEMPGLSGFEGPWTRRSDWYKERLSQRLPRGLAEVLVDMDRRENESLNSAFFRQAHALLSQYISRALDITPEQAEARVSEALESAHTE
jgi:RNA polymerase-interacting CarD/CdnL/TRCF family regulator